MRPLAIASFAAASAAMTGLAPALAQADTAPDIGAANAPSGDPSGEKGDDDPSRWLKELQVEAGTLQADLRLRELDLSEGVKVRLSPYYLRADRIHLSLGTWGVRVVGNGVLTFCPCDSPPIGIGFTGGWAGPPDELVVENPSLRIFGLPVFWLPYLWLRSPRKVGLTLPEVSFRGRDGLFLGQGVHVPLPFGSPGMEIGAGIYTRGGYAGTLDFASDRTTTQLRLDYRSAASGGADEATTAAAIHSRLPDLGAAIDVRGDAGSLESSRALTVAWDVDAIRGARGLRTTLDLEPLARPFDRAAAESRVGPLSVGLVALDRRGAPIDHADIFRPFASLGHAVALGSIGGAQAIASFGPRFIRGRRADAIGDAAVGIDLGAPLGAATFRATMQGDGRLARGGGDELAPGGRASGAVGEARIELSLPLARALSIDRAVGGPPVLHVIEPLIRAAGVFGGARGDREALSGFVGGPLFGVGPSTGAGTGTSAAVFAAGARTAIASAGIAPGTDPWLGRLSAEGTAGALIMRDRRDGVVAGELDWKTRRSDGGRTLFALQGAIARTLLTGDVDRTLGWIALGRIHHDTSREGLGVELRSAARGSMPVIGGWALLGADAAPRLRTATGLELPGTTLGAGTTFPLGSSLRLGGDVDVYAASFPAFGERGETKLLDVRSSIRYRHPCGCFRMMLRGGHVVGREGIDVFATFELAPADPNDPRAW